MVRRMINYNNNSNNGTKTEERSAAAEDRGVRRGLKKGPWTAAEDAILVEYVKRHGEGNWNAVQKNAGLARCGKSCRLRWANHLRPNLKKGAFSPQEEQIIIELHAKLGNKWARMASQLPGRTDNEIKNYWNTRMKRRQRAGLPLYPNELHQQLPQQVQENHQITQNSHSISSNSLSSLLNSQYNPNLSLCNDFSYHVINQLKYNICEDGNFGLPINSHVSQLSRKVSHTLPIAPTFQYNPGGTFGALSSMLTVDPYDPVSRLLASELPSTQTPASSHGSYGDLGLTSRTEKSSRTSTALDRYHCDLVFHESRLGNSGLLDDLLVESRVLSRNDREKRQNGMSYEEEEEEEKGKSPDLEESAEEDDDGFRSESVLKNSGETGIGGGGGGENRTENFSTCDQSSIGIEPSENPLDVSSVDDDLMSLLSNFPTSMPVPNWYPGGGGNLFDRETSAATSGIVQHDDVVVPQNALPTRVSKHDQSLKYSCWNNMPSIC